MKKFLSLVLALVMTMSLVTVSAGAKDFTDASKITYDEAIDVMSTIKVISGYEDGSINPQGALTRGAAAKIICNLVLGPTDAAALAVTEAPYKDVPANSTFAGYISYCKAAGYISGYADGTFKPGAPLTGYAFLKMLLGTLGFDKNIEGYEGTNWSVNVAKRALNLKLTSDYEGTFVGTKAINREEAMLLAFNALQADTYKYDTKGSSINVGGVEITTGASEAKKAGETLMTKLFGSDLKATDTYDNFGRPATKWTYKNKSVGTYAADPKETFTKAATGDDIYNAVSAIDDTTKFGYYVSSTTASGIATATKDDTDTAHNYGGRGVITEVYYSYGKALKTRIVTIAPAIGKVTEVATDKDGRFVMLSTGAKFYTEDYAKNDWLVYNKAAGKNVAEAYKVEKQTGTVTKKVGTSIIYIDGTKYETNANMVGSANVKDKVDFYVDQYGYIIKIAATSSTYEISNLAVTFNGGTDRGQSWEKLTFIGDKKAQVVDTDHQYNYINKIVKYTLDDGEYELEEVGNYYGAYSYTSGAASLAVSGGTVKMDGATTFMLIDSDNEATYYTGIKNAPDFSASALNVVFKDNDPTKAATLVVAYVTNVTNNADDLTFVVYDKDSDTVVEDGKTYKTYNTMTAGVQSTKDFGVADSTLFAGKPAGDKYNNYVVVLSSYNTNSKDVVSSVNFAANVVRSYFIEEPANGVVVIGGQAYALADKCDVYVVSKTGVITTGDLDSIVAEDGAGLHYSNVVATRNATTGKVEQIVLCSVN